MTVVQQQIADRLVDGVAGELETDGAVALDVVVRASVVGHERVAALVVADRHPSAAAAADSEALEQRGSFAGGAGGSVGAVRICVGGQQLLVVLEPIPCEIAGVRVVDQGGPLLARECSGGRAAVGCLAGPALSIDERAGISGVVQRAQHPPVVQLVPRQLAFAWPFADPAWEQQPVALERIDDRARGPGPLRRSRTGGGSRPGRRGQGRARPFLPGRSPARRGAASAAHRGGLWTGSRPAGGRG